jgi:hypothetical protein
MIADVPVVQLMQGMGRQVWSEQRSIRSLVCGVTLWA